jgi:hypothetical protein
MKNRVGKFTVPNDLVEHNYEYLVTVLSLLKFIPTRAESLYHSRAFEYVGFSPKFAEIQLEEEVPKYVLTSVRNAFGAVADVDVEIMKNEKQKTKDN